MRDKLTEEEVRELVILANKAKAAKNAYDLRKAELTADVEAGKSEYANIGCVNKIVKQTPSTDYKQMLLDHPEIDVDDYISTKEVTSIICTSYLPIDN